MYVPPYYREMAQTDPCIGIKRRKWEAVASHGVHVWYCICVLNSPFHPGIIARIWAHDLVTGVLCYSVYIAIIVLIHTADPIFLWIHLTHLPIYITTLLAECQWFARFGPQQNTTKHTKHAPWTYNVGVFFIMPVILRSWCRYMNDKRYC